MTTMILISLPVTIGTPTSPKPPCVAEACPGDFNPRLVAEGATPKSALENLLPMIVAELERIGGDDLDWFKYDCARERAEMMLANPHDYGL